jgi:intracellular sulfur oxidation DsrE/DsrF family protein
MKKLFLILLTYFFVGFGFAQTSQGGGPHKIVFQLTTADTVFHKALMKQLDNILRIAPDSKLEIVCHGPGLEMLMKEKCIVAPTIEAFTMRGVEFVACEFSLKQRKVEKSQIIPSAGFVEAGIIEIVSKQEKGWSYIKSGY